MNLNLNDNPNATVVYKIILAVLSTAATVIAIARFAQSSPTPFFWAMCVICVTLCAVLWHILSQTTYIDFFNEDPDRLVRKAAQLLDQSKYSLYYYGGVGLINTPNNKAWQQAFDRKLLDPNFRIVRMIDLQTLAELRETYKYTDDRFRAAVRQYRKWIGVHKNRFKEKDHTVRASNSIFHFQGAPIWQYGFHIIIFDERHMLLVYRKDLHARCFVMLNRPAVCRDAVAMMNRLQVDLKMQEVTTEQLDERYNELTEFMKQNNVSDSDDDLPFHEPPQT